MITNLLKKIKGEEPLEGLLEDLFVVCLIILVGGASFGLGRLSALTKDKEPITVEYPALIEPIDESAGQGSQGSYVASKNGEKYYATFCSGVNRIKSENRVYFVSEEDAQLSGFTRAESCKF